MTTNQNQVWGRTFQTIQKVNQVSLYNLSPTEASQVRDAVATEITNLALDLQNTFSYPSWDPFQKALAELGSISLIHLTPFSANEARSRINHIINSMVQQVLSQSTTSVDQE